MSLSTTGDLHHRLQLHGDAYRGALSCPVATSTTPFVSNFGSSNAAPKAREALPTTNRGAVEVPPGRKRAWRALHANALATPRAGSRVFGGKTCARNVLSPPTSWATSRSTLCARSQSGRSSRGYILAAPKATSAARSSQNGLKAPAGGHREPAAGEGGIGHATTKSMCARRPSRASRWWSCARGRGRQGLGEGGAPRAERAAALVQHARSYPARISRALPGVGARLLIHPLRCSKA
eukprot:4531764-Prymnesium_polylepis.3